MQSQNGQPYRQKATNIFSKCQNEDISGIIKENNSNLLYVYHANWKSSFKLIKIPFGSFGNLVC